MFRKLATGCSRLIIGLPVLCGWMLTATWVQAAVFNWDGGAGAWDTTGLNWDGGTNAWPAAGTDHEAVFGGTAGVVTINNANNDPVAANGVTFNAGGYTIDGDALTFNGTDPSVHIGDGISATIEAPIAGSGLLQRTGNGQLTIGGSSSNTFSGTTRFVDNSVTWLDKSGGAFALAGPVEMGDGVAFQSHLRTLQSEQFAPGVAIDFINPSGQWSRFDLLGTTQTLAGINTGNAGTMGAGIVQNRSNGDVTSQHGTATLTLDGSGNHLFHGHLRNVDHGAVGDNLLSLVKQGAGTQTLVGGQITYSGGTTIDAGTLELRDTGNNFVSQIEVNAGGTLDITYTTVGVPNRRDLAGPLVTGTGVININNAGSGIAGAWTTVNSNNSGRIWDFDGTININSGVLTRDHVAADTIRGTAAVDIAADGVLGTRGGGVIIGALNGNGRISPLWVGANATTLTLGNGGDSGNFSGTIHGNGLSGIDGTLEGGILSLVKTGGGTQVLSGTLTYTGSTTVNEGRLELFNATTFNSPTTINSGATLSWNGNNNMGNGNAAATIALNNGGTLENLNPNHWTVINGAVTASGTTTINQTSNATGVADRGFFLDGGLHGTGTVTINAANAGSGVNFRNNSSTFSGTLVVNGIADTTPFAGSGISVGGATTAFQNTDITLNGTAELLNQGIGWANTAPGDFWMGALSGNGVMVGNFIAGGETRLRLGHTNNDGTFSGTLTNGTGNVVVMTKVGTGTQTFQGTGINYTGNTTVNAGTLALSQTTNYASGTTTVNPDGTLELHSTNAGVDNWRVNTVLAGTGTINKTGSGWIQTNTNPHTFGGTFNIQEGAFGASFLNSNWTGVIADFHIDAGTLLDARGQAITVGSLNGTGNVGSTWSSLATLNVGAGNKSGNFSGTIHGNATSGTNITANPNAGLLNLVKTGSGTQELSGSNTFSGNVTVNGGILRGSAGNAFGAANNTRTITVNNGATLEFNRVGMYGGHNATAVPSLVINAGGVVSNTSLNNPLNNVTLNGGTLTASASNTAVWRSWNINGTITSSGNSFITPGTAPNPGILLQSAAVSNTNIDVTGGNLTISAPIGNGRLDFPFAEANSSLTKLGGGVLYLDGSNSYTGDTLVNAGFLVARHNNALGAAGNSHVAAGATLQLENNITIAGETAHIIGNGMLGTRGALASWTGNNVWGGDVVLTGDSRLLVFSNSLAVNGAISESAAGSNLIRSGDGALTLGGAASNTYSGTTQFPHSGVTWLDKSGGAVAITGPVQMGDGTAGQPHLRTLQDEQFAPGVVVDFINPAGQWTRLDLLGTDQTLAGINSGDSTTMGSGIVQIRSFGDGASEHGSSTLTINGSGDYLFHGYLRDVDGGPTGTNVLSLVKAGSGTQTLAGSQLTYSGTTTVNDGTLLVHGTHTGGGLYTVNSGGTLGGNGTITAGVDLFGTLSPGASVGTINTGSEIWNNGGNFLFEIDDATGTAGAAGGPGWDLLAVTGTLDLSGLSPGGFTIDIVSLESGGGTNPGLIDNFNGGQQYLWEFVTTTGGVLGFDANLFTLNDSGFANPFGGSFAVLQTSSGLALAYVPEPGADGLGLLGAVGVVLLLWRRKKSL